MEIELGEAELWFCAPGVGQNHEAQSLEIQTASGTRRFWVALVPSRVPAYQAERAPLELFLREETARGVSQVLRRDGTCFLTARERADSGQLKTLIAKMLAGRTNRLWRPASDSRFVLTLQEDGMGAVCGDGEHIYFRWGSERSREEFIFWRDGFDAHFAAIFADSQSLLRRAYEWATWNKSQRDAHVFRCANGDFEEMHALASAVVTLSFDPEQARCYDEFDVWCFLDTTPHEAPSEWMAQWSDVLCALFQPLILEEERPDWEQSHLWQRESRVCLEPRQSQPTNHERLEAQLLLCDWVRENCPEKAMTLLDFPAPLA